MNLLFSVLRVFEFDLMTFNLVGEGKKIGGDKYIAAFLFSVHTTDCLR